jgi:tubulin monoglycylase TTLL3/8
MIDKEFKIYLIEVNTNPCLELSSSLLERIIPSMVDNALKLVKLSNNRIAVDPMFPLVELQTSNKRLPSHNILPENRFLLVFDEEVDSKQLITTKLKKGYISH